MKHPLNNKELGRKSSNNFFWLIHFARPIYNRLAVYDLEPSLSLYTNWLTPQQKMISIDPNNIYIYGAGSVRTKSSYKNKDDESVQKIKTPKAGALEVEQMRVHEKI